MMMPSKSKSQEAMMTEEHKAMRAAANAGRHDANHRELVDAFNSKIISDLGRENCGLLLLA